MLPLPIRFDADSVPALVVGALLLLIATGMGLWQWWVHRQLVLDSTVGEADFAHGERQVRFRLTISGFLFVLGVAIPVGDQLDVFFRGHPGLFFFYWMGVLLLVLVMVAVVVLDALSTLAYVRTSQGDLRQRRSELEAEIRSYHASKNGSSVGESERPEP